MTQLISPKSINFNELIKNSDNSLNIQTKMVNILNVQFTEDEQKWFVANFYVYMHYHPTNDYPINLEDVFKMIGFANKGNAKRTLENNFTKDEDYKILLLRKEKQVHSRNNEEIIIDKGICEEYIEIIVKVEKYWRDE